VPFAPSVSWHAALARRAGGLHRVPARRRARRGGGGGGASWQRIRRAEPDASIAVLVRGRRHLDHITPALKAAGVAFRAVEIEPLAAGPAIRDLEALTRALVSPGRSHRVAGRAAGALVRAGARRPAGGGRRRRRRPLVAPAAMPGGAGSR
jgi:superfamily I DNA/RNA helicase